MDRPTFDSALMRSPLFSGMDGQSRAAIVPRFFTFTFRPDDPIVRAGAAGRHLGVMLAGTAIVQARRSEQAYTVEHLEAGRVFGEMAFFDPQSPRTADIIGTSHGTAALLPFHTYAQMVRDEDPGAAYLEKNVLDLLGRRIQATNQTLAQLLESTGPDSFLDTLRRWFGGMR